MCSTYSLFKYFINKTVLKSLLRGHKVVALGISCNFLDRTSGILSKYPIEIVSCTENKLCLDLDVGCLTLSTSQRLMYHYLTVGESDTLALSTC